MTEILTVPTHFGDLSELSSGLADRVDEERIILYGPQSYDEGDYVSFEVLLLDGTPALEGIGRVAAAVDGGEARAPETRFDIVFDTLQLEGRSEVVYERIVLARQSMLGDEPPTGEVDVQDLEDPAEAAEAEAEDIPMDEGLPEADVDVAAEEAVEAPAEDAYEEEVPQEAFDEPPVEEAVDDMDQDLEDLVSFSDSEMPPPPEDAEEGDPAAYAEAAEQEVLDEAYDGEQATVVASIEDIQPAAERPSGAPPPSLPDAPQGFEMPPPPQGLTRPIFASSWWPTAEARPEPRMSSGYFDHRGGLPVPEQPPRPDIDPTLRVSPAPRPGAQSADPQPAYSEPPEAPAEDAYAMDEAPMDEAPIDEAPMDEVPMDEAPIEEAPMEDTYDEAIEDEYDAGETTEAPLDYDGEGDDVMFDEAIEGDATAHEMPLPEES